MAGQARDSREVHNRVRLLRTEYGLTRAELADRVGVNRQTIGALERGDHRPSLLLAFSICEVFELPVEAVFSMTPFAPRGVNYYAPAAAQDRDGNERPTS